MGKGEGWKKNAPSGSVHHIKQEPEATTIVNIDQGKKKKPKKKKVPRFKKVATRHAQSTDFANDGVNAPGRVGIILGTVALLLYLLALSSPEWTLVDNVGSGVMLERDPAIASIGKGKFGLWTYCLDTKIALMMNQSRSICHIGYKLEEYKFASEVVVKNETSGEERTDRIRSKYKQNACDHFEKTEICTRKYVIQWFLIPLCFFMLVGDVYSSILALNALCCAAGTLIGAAVVGAWMKVYQEFKAQTDGDVKHGNGFIFMCTGFVSAFLATTFMVIDLAAYPDTERFGCANDGMVLAGYVGTFLAVMVWMLWVTLLPYPNWSNTKNLGDDTHFYEEGLGDVDEATFGLLSYCLQLSVPAFDDTMQYVCLGLGEQVAFSSRAKQDMAAENIETQNACEIFDTFKYCEKSEMVIWGMVIAIVIAFIGDIFSEKMAINAAIMFLCFLCGCFGMYSWLTFTSHISGPKKYAAAAKVVPGFGLYGLAMGTLFGFVSCCMLYVDHADICEPLNDWNLGKDTEDQGRCNCILITGSGTSGYDGKAENLTARDERQDKTGARDELESGA